jgi:hypothetical protein
MNREIQSNIQNKGLPKKDYQGIEKENEHLKAPPKYFEISWQTYRLAGFVLLVLSFAAMKYIIDYFNEQIEDRELMNILKIISFFFILNFGTFLFVTIYYKYRKSIKGIKGPKGNLGKRGHQGSSSYCNICEIKTGGYRREYKNKPLKENIVESVLIDFENIPSKGWVKLPNIVTLGSGDSAKSHRIMSHARLGPGSINQSEVQNNPRKCYKSRPIIGVSASFNKETGEIYTIMYLVDKTPVHNPEKYRYVPLNKDPYGLSSKLGSGIEFKAPPNSAVNKIELFHDGNKIKCMKFYCADIHTGNPVKVLDPSSNKMRKYANIGGKVSRADKTINYQYVESTGIVHNDNDKVKYYPSFISEVEGWHNTSTGIFNLGFSKSSIYQDGFKLNVNLNPENPPYPDPTIECIQ